jgi:hypothetical protein
MPVSKRLTCTFLPHLLDDDGAVARVTPQFRRLGLHLARITEAGTSRPPGTTVASAVACIRRPGRRPCRGHILVHRAEVPPEIQWSCPLCGDRGVISGWEGTLYDLRGEHPAEGQDLIEACLDDASFRALRRDGLTAIEPCRLLAAATWDGLRVVLHGSAEELGELREQIAAEANDERGLRRFLDEAFDALDTAIEELGPAPDRARRGELDRLAGDLPAEPTPSPRHAEAEAHEQPLSLDPERR